MFAQIVSLLIWSTIGVTNKGITTVASYYQPDFYSVTTFSEVVLVYSAHENLLLHGSDIGVHCMIDGLRPFTLNFLTPNTPTRMNKLLPSIMPTP
jgi:hypothetical protein